jgi:HlyD family secretion protein
MGPTRDTLNELRIDRPTAARRPRRYGWVVALLVGVGLVLAVLLVWTSGSKAVVVRTAAVQEVSSSAGQTLLNASGYVTARREATVSSKSTAKVLEVLVEEGMKVEAGQVLARLDASNVERSLRRAEANVDLSRKALGETKANLEQAQRELKRFIQLVPQNSATQTELDRADALVKSLNARIEHQTAAITVSEREVAMAQQELDDTIIRAPFAGVVTSKNAQPGEMISPVSAGGGFTRTGICTLVDMTSLEIEVDVNESYINRVEPGQPVEAVLDAYPDWRIPAKVIAIIPTADRQKATVKVRIAFDKLDKRILPDMSVKAAFQSERSATQPATVRSFTIPKSAVRQRDGHDVVFIVHDGKAERRAVTVGLVTNDAATIIAGVNGGERVVVEAPDDLGDGAAVKETK